ncbi:MAG: hypothetical protein Q8K45_03020, partial [Rubrivivax sp.]|nr:hypothetical protein [Rubrivivax sp.]
VVCSAQEAQALRQALGEDFCLVTPGIRPANASQDDQVRIEEVRDAHGRLQRVTVHSKVGGKSYEIIVPPGGKDNSQHRGTSGQAAWRLFDF